MANYEFIEIPPEDEQYVVFRFRHLLHFIPKELENSARKRMMLAKKAGFDSGTQLLYLSTYVVDTNNYEVIKNRYPEDVELPRIVFDSLFSGVIPHAIEI